MNDLKKIDFLAEFDFYGKKIIFPVGINSIIDNSFKCYFFDCFERRKSKEFLSSSYRFNDIYKRYEHFSSSTGPVVINKKDIVTIIYIVDLKNQEIILEFYCKQ